VLRHGFNAGNLEKEEKRKDWFHVKLEAPISNGIKTGKSTDMENCPRFFPGWDLRTLMLEVFLAMVERLAPVFAFMSMELVLIIINWSTDFQR
jgi:hypothetical protein